MGAIKNINLVCTTIERSFNILGSLPVLSIGSGIGRAAFMGIPQVVIGSIFGTIGAIALEIEKARKHPNPERIKKFKIMKIYSAQHAFHGLGNIVRGVNEATLGYFTFGLGNLVLFLPYNILYRPLFEPVVPYTKPNINQRVFI